MIPWIGSVRSIASLIVAGTYAYLAIVGKMDAKDIMVITLLVFNWYFQKDRPSTNGTTPPPGIPAK